VPIVLHAHAPQRVEYYRSEDTFRAGLKLFDFEIRDTDYLEVIYSDLGFVDSFRWFTKTDSLIKSRLYEYWEDDLSVKRLLETTPDSLILRELLFGDELKSRQFIEYAFGVDVVADFRDRFTEVIYDSMMTIVAYKIMSTQGNILGAIFFDYDSLGYLINETWFKGNEMDRVREFRYKFDHTTGTQEVIERGIGGQVVSHVLIKGNPHQNLSAGSAAIPPGTISPADSAAIENLKFE
jgi:hypothetical protein